MKLAVAIASEDALSSAFVVFRGIEDGIKNAGKLGYDGVELALQRKEEIDISAVRALIRNLGLEIPAISTGQVFAGAGLCFTDPDEAIRNKAINVIEGLIELASEFGAKINIGRVRGSITIGGSKEAAKYRFIETMRHLSDHSLKYGVELIIEPVNRYEINFINSLNDGAMILDDIKRNNVKLMPDLFHMNIEDRSIIGSFKKHIKVISYIHIADSNREAPGQGHLDFHEIINVLNELNYRGWLSAEILPIPDPYTAAKLSIDHIRTLISNQ